MDKTTLQQLVNRISIKFFNKPFKDDVVFNSRLRTTGGRYIPAEQRIELNPKYLLETDSEEFHGIIKHELCHYHLHISGKGYKHGDADFKELLKRTGSPRYCRALPSEAGTYKYQYNCKKCGTTYNRKRKVNIEKYRCGKCKGRLIAI